MDGDLIVLAVRRQGRDRGPENTGLQPGDVLLIEGDWAVLESRSDERDLLVVDSPKLVRRQAVPIAAGSTPAIVILVAMVVMLATGIVPPVLAALLAAGAMLLFKVLTVHQTYQGTSWSTVLLVAGMMPMSAAITKSRDRSVPPSRSR